MGYLDNDTIVVDAILTKHGRELLSDGVAINPTHFALSDDGIDYSLWNPNSASGSSGYDDYITKLPMLEAVPDHSVQMNYTLFTAQQNLRIMPTVDILNPKDNYIYELRNKETIKEEHLIEFVLTNFADTGETFNVNFYDMTGIDIVSTDGAFKSKYTGKNNPPQEKGVPIPGIVSGCTFVTITDKVVMKDTEAKVKIVHPPTGAMRMFTVKIYKHPDIAA